MVESGKNKRRQFEAYDSVHDKKLLVDSVEESDYINWLCEAHDLSVINEFEYQPSSFLLFDSYKYHDVNNKEKTLFREHIYTPDFIVAFNPTVDLNLSKEFKISYDQLSSNECSAYIDVKGSFARNDGGRSFSINLKWVWDKFNVYIYKLIPKMFFKKFGCPQLSLCTAKTKKPRKMFLGYDSLSSIFFNK